MKCCSFKRILVWLVLTSLHLTFEKATIVSGNIFIRRNANFINSNGHTALYKKYCTKSLDEVQPVEDSILSVACDSPILFIQSTAALLVLANYVAELLNLVPSSFVSRVRSQCSTLIIAAKLMDIAQTFDASQHQIIELMSSANVIETARNETKALLNSKASQLIAFHAIGLLTSCRVDHTCAFIVSDLPNMLRYVIIVILATSSRKNQPPLSGIRELDWLFTNTESVEQLGPDITTTNLEKKNAASINEYNLPLDRTCDAASYVIEMYVLFSIVSSILWDRSDSSVRGLRDLMKLTAQVVIISNYVHYRSKSFASSVAAEQIINEVRSRISMIWEKSVLTSAFALRVPELPALRLFITWARSFAETWFIARKPVSAKFIVGRKRLKRKRSNCAANTSLSS